MINFPKVLKRMIIPKGDPMQFIFFITARCNLFCKHCFYADSLNKATNELRLDEYEKISRSMKDLLWISFTGGEPFLRKDIHQIAEFFYKNNHPHIFSINTNGVLKDLTLTGVERICAACPKTTVIIYVSLDGMEETHNRIRGIPNGFQKSLEVVREIKKLKKRFKNLNVSIITTINAINQHEMKELALYLMNEVKPDNISVNMIRGKPRYTSLGEVNLKNYFDFTKIQQQGWNSGNLKYFNFWGKMFVQKKELMQKKLIATIYKERKYAGVPCLAGSISGVMSEEGDVFPCEVLTEKIGNIRDVNYDIRKLWYSKKADELRDFIKNTNCHCTYECAMTTSVLFNPKQLMKSFFLKEKDIYSISNEEQQRSAVNT